MECFCYCSNVLFHSTPEHTTVTIVQPHCATISSRIAMSTDVKPWLFLMPSHSRCCSHLLILPVFSPNLLWRHPRYVYTLTLLWPPLCWWNDCYESWMGCKGGKTVITQAVLSDWGHAGGGFMALPLPELCTYVWLCTSMYFARGGPCTGNV